MNEQQIFYVERGPGRIFLAVSLPDFDEFGRTAGRVIPDEVEVDSERANAEGTVYLRALVADFGARTGIKKISDALAEFLV